MATIQDLETKANDLGYDRLRLFKERIDELRLEDLRALLAYEFAKDGMDWDFVEDVWVGANPLYQDESSIKTTLVDIFGY